MAKPGTLSNRDAERQELLIDAHEQLLRRDGDLQSLADELVQCRAEHKRVTEELRTHIHLQGEEIRSLGVHVRERGLTIERMEATRVWKLGQRYWALRDFLRRLLRPGRTR